MDRVCRSFNKLRPDVEIHCVALRSNGQDFTQPEVAVQEDLCSISQSDGFVLIYPEVLPSSALIELGFALGLDKPCLIVTPKRSCLPFLARNLDKARYGVEIVEAQKVYSEKTVKAITSFSQRYMSLVTAKAS